MMGLLATSVSPVYIATQDGGSKTEFQLLDEAEGNCKFRLDKADRSSPYSLVRPMDKANFKWLAKAEKEEKKMTSSRG